MNDFDEPLVNESLRSRMRADRRQVLMVIALLLAALAVPQAFLAWASKPQLPPPLKPSAAQEFRGITLQLHSYDEAIPFEQYVEEIAQTGANTICLSVAAYQENCASSSLFVEYRKVPSVARVLRLIELARRRGLHVIFMPIVLLENPGSGEWRGEIGPVELEDWWNDYEGYILFYARIAQQAGADVFLVGSELVTMEKHVARWRSLIAKVRKAFNGSLAYSANWDHYEPVEWWDDLDIIGMTSYHDLVGDEEPSLEVLLKTWRPIKKKILDWQKHTGRKILFTEAGWPSQKGCAKEPWNYYGSKVPDLATQALCFRAFFETWRDEPAVGGVLVWEWRNHPKQTGGATDISYIPNGKPAMEVIQEYFRYRRPGRPSTAPADETATTAPDEAATGPDPQ